MHENLTQCGDINTTDHIICYIHKNWYEISLAVYSMICEKKPTLIGELYGNENFSSKLNRWIPLNIS